MEKIILFVILTVASTSSHSYNRRSDGMIHSPWFRAQPGVGGGGFSSVSYTATTEPINRWHPWDVRTATTTTPIPTTSTTTTERATTTTERATTTTKRATTTSERVTMTIYSCIAACLTTSELNPVCGTDNITYLNIGKLTCAQTCGVDVQLKSYSPCSPIPRSVPDNSKTDAELVASCISNCPVTLEYNPVCGTDNVTYANPARLECAKNCGVGIQLSKSSSCSLPPGPIKPNPSGSTVNGNGNGSGNKPQTLSDILTCMQLCPITPDVNPVCGTDGVTYSNPGRLLCLQHCGVDVKVLKYAPCLDKLTFDPYTFLIPSSFLCPTEATTNVTRPTSIQYCIKNCVMTQSRKFKPVCGTNDITYINIESLQCMKNCGLDVSVQKLSPCRPISTEKPTPQTPPVWGNTVPTRPTVTQTPSSDMQTCINSCPTLQDYTPVCGTDGLTYPNIQRLQCAKQCGINVSLKSMSACFTTPPIDGSKGSTTENNDLGFTISPDILANVFFPALNVPTEPTTSESDESYGIDIKFGET